MYIVRLVFAQIIDFILFLFIPYFVMAAFAKSSDSGAGIIIYFLFIIPILSAIICLALGYLSIRLLKFTPGFLVLGLNKAANPYINEPPGYVLAVLILFGGPIALLTLKNIKSQNTTQVPPAASQ